MDIPSFLIGLVNDVYTIYPFFLPVLIPKGKYNGQKLIRLVSINIADKISSTIANVPEITFTKYKTIITMAISILTTLSIVPMFFFIFIFFKFDKYNRQPSID